MKEKVASQNHIKSLGGGGGGGRGEGGGTALGAKRLGYSIVKSSGYFRLYVTSR